MLGGPHHPAPTEPPKTPLRGTATPTPPAFIWVLDESRGDGGGTHPRSPQCKKQNGQSERGCNAEPERGEGGGGGGSPGAPPHQGEKRGSKTLTNHGGIPALPPTRSTPFSAREPPYPGSAPLWGGHPGPPGEIGGGGSVRPGAAAGGTQRRSAPPPGTQCGGAVPARGAHGRDAPGNGGCMAASGDPSGAEERRNGERERLKARRQRPSRVMCSRGKLYPGLGRAGPGRAGLSPGRSGGGGGGGGGERAGGRAPPRLPLAPPPRRGAPPPPWPRPRRALTRPHSPAPPLPPMGRRGGRGGAARSALKSRERRKGRKWVRAPRPGGGAA